MKRESSLSRSWPDVDKALNTIAQQSVLVLGTFQPFLPSALLTVHICGPPIPGLLASVSIIFFVHILLIVCNRA